MPRDSMMMHDFNKPDKKEEEVLESNRDNYGKMKTRMKGSMVPEALFQNVKRGESGDKEVEEETEVEDNAMVKYINKRVRKVGLLFSYNLDRAMRYKANTILILAVVAFIIVVWGGIVSTILVSDVSMSEGMWRSWTYLADPGSQGDASGLERVGASLVSVCGIFFMATLLGFVVDIVGEKMEQLRQGKSIVVEKNHTLILGWTDKIISLVQEICLANETTADGTHGGIIVVLADRDHQEMEQEMFVRIPPGEDENQRMGSRIVCRSGSALASTDLEKVAAQDARAILILSDSAGSPDKADAASLRVLLALCGMLPGESSCHIVTEIQDIDNEPLFRLAGGKRIETVVSHDIVGRLMLMSVRTPGLIDVYEEILGFEGDEFYSQEWAETIGVPFGDLPERFPDAIPIGIKTADKGIILKPDRNRRVQEGEEIIVIAEDDDSYEYVEPEDVEVHPGPPARNPAQMKEKILFCGWRRDCNDMIELLDTLVIEGSELHMMCTVPLLERKRRLEDAGLYEDSLENLTIIQHEGNTGVRRHMDNLPVDKYTTCLVMSDESFEEDLMHSDSHSMTSLLLLRDIQTRRAKKKEAMLKGSPNPDDEMVAPKGSQKPAGQGSGRRFTQMLGMEKPDETPKRHKKKLEMDDMVAHVRSNSCPAVIEILDPRTQKSIESNVNITALSEFVQTNRMVSLVLAMVAEDRSVNTYLDELLGGEGCSLELRKAHRYVHPNEVLTFLQLAKRVQEYELILVGYASGVPRETIVNPRDKSIPVKWGETEIELIILHGPPMHPGSGDHVNLGEPEWKPRVHLDTASATPPVWPCFSASSKPQIAMQDTVLRIELDESSRGYCAAPGKA